jgi:hypothetical protein
MSEACYCDYDAPEAWSSRISTARKPHVCEECSCIIQPGEKYEYVWGKWEGIVSIFKTCTRCLEIRSFVKASVPCFCWAHGNLHEDARDTAQHYMHEADGLMFGTLRRIVLAERAPKFERA